LVELELFQYLGSLANQDPDILKDELKL